MRVRSLGASTEWLGGTARRWVALVGFAATALGIVSFVLSEDLSWAWLAIGSLLLLVMSLGSELWIVEHRMAAHQAPLLDRAIADGHALLTISDHTSFVMQWDRHWRPETYEMLRREFGLSAALDFADAMDSLLRETGRQDPRAWTGAQVECLERLRSRVAGAGGLVQGS
jgi:hypothetical protein